MKQNIPGETRQQHDVVKGEFKKQAAGWGRRQDNLAEAAQSLDLQAGHTVLDVATGSALFASAIAPHVKQVVACDITPEMLAQANARDIPNIRCLLAAAEALPHATGAFDRVVTRYSLHHIQQPSAAIKEIHRVCCAGGSAMIIDIVSPEDTSIADRYNRLERLRDPSHREALPFSTLRQMLKDAGFKLQNSHVSPLGEMDVDTWFELAQTGPDQRKEILKALEVEFQQGTETGFHPLYRDGKLKIVHTVGTFLVKK